MKSFLIVQRMLVIWLCCIPALISAQNSDVGQVTQAYALVNATVVSAPGVTQQNTTVLIEDGMIKAIGANLKIPAHAQTIACDSMYIYAGFIESLSHTGIPTRDNNNQERPRVDNPGTPPNDLAGIQPEQQARDVIKEGDKSIANMRALGFTLSHVVPKGRMLPGKGSLVLLSDEPVDNMIMKEDVSLYAQFRGAQGMYPATVIGVMAKWRDLYRQAMYTSEQHSHFVKNGGITRPKYDQATEAMFPVVANEIPVFFSTPNSLQMHQAMHLQKDLGFDLVLAECKQGWRLLDELKQAGKPVVVSLDLPDDKGEKDKKKDEDEQAMEKSAEEMTKAKLEARRAESYLMHCEQAAKLSNAGIPLAFSSVNVKSKDVRENLRTMIEHGLSEESALAALTTVPASLFGIDAYTGTVEKGKLANLVVSNMPYFEKDAQVRYVFVEGAKHEYELKAKKKAKSPGDPDAKPAAIAGSWTFEVEIPGQTQTGTISMKGEDGDYSGTLQADDDDEILDVYNVEVVGNTVTFNMDMTDDGQSMTLDFEIEVDEDTYEGEVTVPNFGTFPISGEKIPE